MLFSFNHSGVISVNNALHELNALILSTSCTNIFDVSFTTSPFANVRVIVLSTSKTSVFPSLFSAINKMAEKYDMPVLYSCHPRSRNRLAASGFELDPRVIRHEPMGFHDYNCLQMNAFAVVSDSGTLPEESSFFTSIGKPFPAVCIRTSTERPEALDKACFVLAGIDTASLLQAVDTAVEMNRNGDHGIPVPDYVEENVSTKVVKIIQSYTGVVDKMVWKEMSQFSADSVLLVLSSHVYDQNEYIRDYAEFRAAVNAAE